MKKLWIFVAALFTFGAAHAADPAAGEAKAAVCTACHGVGGNAPILETYPKIGGQNAAYLEIAIQAYKSGERGGGNSALMTPIVGALSDTDIANIAAYFSSVK